MSLLLGIILLVIVIVISLHLTNKYNNENSVNTLSKGITFEHKRDGDDLTPLGGGKDSTGA